MAKMIQLSSIHNVYAPEGSFGREKPVPEEDFKILLASGTNKSSVINFFINSYLGNGDFSAVNIKEQTKNTLEVLFKEIVAYVIEEKLKSCLFTYLDAGTFFYAMKVLEGPAELKNKIVKVAMEGKNFEKDAAPGYKTAKDYFGVRASVQMTLTDINVRSTNSEGLPCVVFLDNTLIQERTIVIKNILSVMDQNKKTLREQYRLKGLAPDRISDMPEMKKLEEERKKIIGDFQKLYQEEMKGRGFEDKDDGEAAMDRNYGFRVPPGFVHSDWGFNDYSRLRRTMPEMQVVGFDFDSIRQLRENLIKKNKIEIKKDRVPDVFSADIKTAWKELLEKILIKRA